jgi:hypothetical protein
MGLELCCVPFALYNVALEDIIEVSEDGHLRVIRSSGRHVIRVHLKSEASRTLELVRRLEDVGAQCEAECATFLAIDATNETVANRVIGIFTEWNRTEFVEYEVASPNPDTPVHGV